MGEGPRGRQEEGSEVRSLGSELRETAGQGGTESGEGRVGCDPAGPPQLPSARGSSREWAQRFLWGGGCGVRMFWN